MIELGGNITLSGFKKLDNGSIIIIKKMVGNYVKKISEKNSGFESLSLNLKTVHNNKYEINAKAIISGRPTNSEVTGKNLFITFDQVMNKLTSAIE